MKVVRIMLLITASGTAYGTYAWLMRVPEVPATEEARREAIEADPQKKAVVEMARFLEAAPTAQLGAMIKTPGAVPAGADAAPKWDYLVPFTKRTESGVLLAQMMAGPSPLGTEEDAKKKLMENPRRALDDVQVVLEDLPENFAHQRSELLGFTVEISRNLEDRSPITALLLKESQRIGTSPRAVGDLSLVPQAAALQYYYSLEPNLAKQAEAYQAALQAQTDPGIRQVLERLEVHAPSPVTPAPIAQAPMAEPGGLPVEARDLDRDHDREPAAQPPPDDFHPDQ